MTLRVQPRPYFGYVTEEAGVAVLKWIGNEEGLSVQYRAHFDMIIVDEPTRLEITTSKGEKSSVESGFSVFFPEEEINEFCEFKGIEAWMVCP